MSITGASSAIGGTTTGVPLQAVIDAPRRLDELSTARIVGEAAEAVHRAQKNGKALDGITPSSIILADGTVRLDLPPTPPTAYIAPERLQGGDGDRRSDVFSLGVVLWEALAHKRLFEGATEEEIEKAILHQEIRLPSEHNANVPAELDAICKKALARDPSDRYQSAKVMAAEIAAVLDDAGYPEGNEEIAKYLTAEFPNGPTSTSPKAETKAPLNQTILGMAPLREVPPASQDQPAAAEPNKSEAKSNEAEPEAKADDTKADDTKADDTKADDTKADDTKADAKVADANADTKTDAAKADDTKTEAKADGTKADDKPASSESSASASGSKHGKKKKKKGHNKPEPKSASPSDAKPTTASSTSAAEAATTASESKPEAKPEPKTDTKDAGASSTEAAAAVDPRDAVSLPNASDVLAGWGWADDDQASIDSSAYEEDAPDDTRKRLLLAIGGALAVLVLVLVVALAASGGDDKPEDSSQNRPSATTNGRSRTAPDPIEEPQAAATEPAPTEPAPTEPSANAPSEPAASEPTSAVATPPEPEPAPAVAAAATTAPTPAPLTATFVKPEPAEPATPTEPAKPEPEKTATTTTTATSATTAKVATAAPAAKAEPATTAKVATAAPAAKAEPATTTKVATAAPATKAEPAKKTTTKTVAKTATAQPEDPYATPAKPAFDPAAAYKQGFQQYVRGDTAGALATFQSSLAQNPKYPPTWRGLGLAFEKLGRTAEAKKAFSRYLQLAPDANDAAQIRSRMEKLK